jgi:hypothetical protein
MDAFGLEPPPQFNAKVYSFPFLWTPRILQVMPNDDRSRADLLKAMTVASGPHRGAPHLPIQGSLFAVAAPVLMVKRSDPVGQQRGSFGRGMVVVISTRPFENFASRGSIP